MRGLDVFREWFRNFTDRFVLIGGAACHVAMSEAGVDFRATKDLDIVLLADSIQGDFARALWDFIADGGYALQQEASGKMHFYRFKEPQREEYPFMLELFSRAPEGLPESAGLTRISMEGEVSSLSAILLDEDYYRLIHDSRIEAGGLPCAPPHCLIPLKARAWLDLSERKAGGEQVDSKSIRKHKNDVFRLYRILDPDTVMPLPKSVLADLEEFLTRMETEGIDLKAMGSPGRKLPEVLEDMRRVFTIS